METSVDLSDSVNNLNNHSVALFENADNAASELSGGISIYLTMFIYLIVVAAIIAGLLLLRKYLINRLGTVKNGSYMRILDRIVIAQDKQIVLVELKSKILVVGITQQRIETLSELSREELDIIEQNAGGGMQGEVAGFARILGDRLKTSDTPRGAPNVSDNPNTSNMPRTSDENNKQ